jgi:hypothetical protein
MDFKAVGCDGIDWIQLAHDVVQHGVEPSGFIRGGEFLEKVTVKFPRKGLYHGARGTMCFLVNTM